jgi:hypothetical protein
LEHKTSQSVSQLMSSESSVEYRIVLRHDLNCFPCHRYAGYVNAALYSCDRCSPKNMFGHADIHTVGGSELCSSCATNLGTPILQIRSVGPWTNNELPATTLAEHRVILAHNYDCPGCHKDKRVEVEDFFTSCKRCLRPLIPAGIHCVGEDQMCRTCADKFGLPRIQYRRVESWSDYREGEHGEPLTRGRLRAAAGPILESGDDDELDLDA